MEPTPPDHAGPASEAPDPGGTAAPHVDPAERDASAASQVHTAVTQVLRWASRGDVRREMFGAEGADLSPTDGWLLAAIRGRGPVRASDLAVWQGVDKSTMALQVRRLEDRGLVGRRPDPDDRRAVLLTLTPRGAQVQERIAAAGAAVVDRVLAEWDTADRQALAVLLSRFADGLERPAQRG